MSNQQNGQNPQNNPVQPMPEQGMSRWLKIVIGTIFYIGLGVYLLASIEHVAWFFNLYEPRVEHPDFWTLLPGFAKAAALDLAIFFLAYIAATGQSTDKAVVWIFTILLTGISLYANYIHAMFHNPQIQADVWNIQIMFGMTTTGWLSPLISSSYPLFAMVFLYLIERVISRRAETVDEMRARIAATKEKLQLEQELKELSKGKTKAGILSFIDTGVDVFNHAKNKVSSQAQSTDQSHDESGDQEQSKQDAQEDQSTINNGSMSDSNSVQSGNQSRTDEPFNSPGKDNQLTTLDGLRGRDTLPIEQVAQMLGLTINHVKSLRKKGTLKTAALNPDRITVASIKAFNEKRSSRNQSSTLVPFNVRPGDTEPLAVLNGHSGSNEPSI